MSAPYRNNGNLDRVKTFIQAYYYSNDGCRFNAIQSAIKAGYSKTWAKKQSFLLIGEDRSKSPNKVLWDAIRAESEKIKSKTTITREDLLEGYKREINADPRHLFDEDGKPILPHLLPDDVALSIQSIEISEKGIKYKLPSKRANRKDLIDWIYTDKKDADTNVNVKLQWAVFPAEPKSLEQWNAQAQAVINSSTPTTPPPDTPTPSTPGTHTQEPEPTIIDIEPIDKDTEP